ncbi:MAG: aminopeptidase P family protein [Bacteroidetes bacterium]|nr:aminopeptidase P family protein [Bacteroidota bacterium]
MIQELISAQNMAEALFKEAEKRNYFVSGQTEKQLNDKLFKLAEDLYGIKKYWHKRIVRAGENTLFPYKENPDNLQIQRDDILFFDFGPVFEQWEADYGKTYVLGNDPSKIKLKNDVEEAWYLGKKFFDKNLNSLTGADLYSFTKELAYKFGWEYGNDHCGHLIGNFPHEKIQGEDTINYLHPDNNTFLKEIDSNGNKRYWIYEIHFIDREKKIGGFFEQLVSAYD